MNKIVLWEKGVGVKKAFLSLFPDKLSEKLIGSRSVLGKMLYNIQMSA